MEDIAFLVLCMGGPILMVLALLWLAVRAVWDWWAVRSLGWDVGNEDDVRSRLQSAPTLSGRVYSRVRRQADILAVTTKTKVKGGGNAANRPSRTTTHLLIWPHANVGQGLIARRTGGFVERTVERFAPSVQTPESWSWARVHGPVDAAWLTDERGQALEQRLSGDLYLLNDHVALSGHSLARLMREASELRQALDRALSG